MNASAVSPTRFDFLGHPQEAAVHMHQNGAAQVVLLFLAPFYSWAMFFSLTELLHNVCSPPRLSDRRHSACSRSLFDIDMSTVANAPRPSAMFSLRKMLHCIPANIPAVFQGLRLRIWPHLLRLAPNGNVGQAPSSVIGVSYPCCLPR